MAYSWLDGSAQGSPPPGSLLVEARGEGFWEFAYPRLTMTIYEYFHQAIDAWRAGEAQYAEARYRQLLADYPEFLDAYHHLAMLLDEAGREEAFALWQHAVRLGEEALPEEVRAGAGRLPWLMLDNRPFLRACHGLGLKLLERGQVEGALAVFIKLLDWNPDDNQGVRALAVDCYFRLDQPRGVLEICDRYAEDGMDSILYGRPLALIQMGNINWAREALELAIHHLPLVARELAKKRHRAPKGFDPDAGTITLWSPEQAYQYWLDYGSYWKRTPGALDLVREVLEETSDESS